MTTLQYREFQQPAFAKGPHSVRNWETWLRNEHVVHDFALTPNGTCSFCGGVCDPKYGYCYDCKFKWSQHLTRLVPASYSLDNGLESLLHRYKDWKGYEWASNALGSILSRLLELHGDCLSLALGRDPVYTWVPSNNPNRTFDHLEKVIDSVEGLRQAGPWTSGLIKRNLAVQRPARNELAPDAYKVDRGVAGRPVLLFDDVWTTGASMGSAAAALRQAGASSVVGVVLGRQLNRSFGRWEAQSVFADVEERGWSLDECNSLLCRRT